MGRRTAADERSQTFSGVVDAATMVVDCFDIDADLEALCTTDESPHRATFRGRTQHYLCMLDVFVVPFLHDASPADGGNRLDVDAGDIDGFTVSETSIDADPPEAVLPFGVASDAGDRSTADHGPVVAYRQICPYGKAFAARAEYDE